MVNKITTKVELTADDRASAKIRDARQEVDKLDGKTASVKVDGDVSGLEDALDALDVPMSGLASKLGGLGSPGGAVAAIAGGLLLAANHAADLAIEADNISTLTGDSVEEASRLNAVWKQSGADTKDLQDVLLQMNGVLASNATIAKTLGVNLDDGATIGQRFKQVAEALDKIPDAAKRSQIASQVFGEEGVRQYNALRNSVDDLSGALAAVPDGSVISAEDVEQARKTKKEITELKVELTSFATAIGKVAIPAVSKLVGTLNDTFDGAERAGRNLRAMFDSGAAKNFEIVETFEDGEAAAAAFDRALLDGLDTFEVVRAKVLALTDSEHAANVVALEWAEANQEVAAAVADNSEATEYLDGLLRKHQDAVDDARAAVDRLRKAHELEADALNDETDAVYAAIDSQYDYEKAAWATTDAVNALREAEKEHGAASSEARREMVGSAEAAYAQATAFAQSKGAAEGSTTAALLQRDELSRLKAFFPELGAEIDRYIAKLNAIPTVRTTVLVQTSSGGFTTKQATNRSGRLVAGATGAIVNRPTMALIGEAGPEAVVPLDKTPGNGPVSALRGGGGMTVNLTVNAGMGANGADIGRIVVEELRKYERFNGPGWRT
jgi:hypothetical protein